VNDCSSLFIDYGKTLYWKKSFEGFLYLKKFLFDEIFNY
jgi:hypothetical protein